MNLAAPLPGKGCRSSQLGFYDSIYRQGSSVAHCDLSSINMLGLYQSPEGLVLAPDPHIPIELALALHCAIFDIVQCCEALARAGVPASVGLLDALVDEWWACVRRTGILGDAPR